MEIRAGFEPATNRFAVCPLEPLEYRIMLVIRAGLEPSITALKGLCPNRLDERTILGRGLPMLSDRSHKNIINADIKQCRKNNQIINSGKGRAVLPLVDGLRRIEAEDHL